MPKCSDSSTACSSKDITRPAANRRLEGARLVDARGPTAGIRIGVDMLIAAENIV
jgi:hypothetical protein